MYQYKNPYTLDFSGLKYYSDIHRILKEELDFPEYYGENWDALWDCLTDMVGQKIVIEIYGMEVLRQKFPEDAESLLGIFREFKHYREDKYSTDILIYIVDGKTEIGIS